MFYLFIIAAVVVVLVIGLSMIDERDMPWTCPHCFASADRDPAGEYRPWYVALDQDRVRCRTCGARFKESANGSLVHDR